MCFSPQRRAICRHRNFKKCSEDYSFSTFSLPNVLFDTAACNFSTSELQKVLRRKTTVFQHFHCQMCFSPQRRTIIRHQNVQKCSRTLSFLTFSLPNVLFTTGACIFSTSEITKVVRTRHVLCTFASKCAFRHSGVQFFICLLSTYLRTRRFNRPTFRRT